MEVEMRKIAGCLGLAFLLFADAASAEDPLKNQKGFVYPIGTMIIADELLPEAVMKAAKNRILISISFFETGKPKEAFFTSKGTGFSIRPGFIISARHVLWEAEAEVERRIWESGNRVSYETSFSGWIMQSNGPPVQFPLYPVAVGEDRTLKDFILFRVGPDVLDLASKDSKMGLLPGEDNPYHILWTKAEFAEAEIGEKVFVTGLSIIPLSMKVKDNDQWQIISLPLDFRNFIHSCTVLYSIENMPVNSKGLKKVYVSKGRFGTVSEPGYSGGPVFNKDGRIIGMAWGIDDGFAYTISSADINSFLDHYFKKEGAQKGK